MRFSSALVSKQQPVPVDASHREAEDSGYPVLASSVQAWPADSPPDDLDQRVRQVGEWQLGEW
jgi:hypothetical protein